MAWTDDLQALLEETGSNLLTSPVGQAGVGALTSDAADFALKTLDLPASVGRGVLGSVVNVGQGEGLAGIGLEPGQREWDESIQGLRNAELGPGGSLGILKLPIELAMNVGVDPLTYTGVGLAGRAGQAAGRASNVATLTGRPGMSQALRLAERGLSGAQAINDAPARFGLPPLQAGVRGVGRGITKLKPNALLPSERQMLETSESLIDNTLISKRSAAGTRPGPPTVPKIEPIASTPIPPVPPAAQIHPPRSAPGRFYEQMAAGWTNFWNRQQRLGIANVDAPTTPTTSADGRLLWQEPKDVRLTDEDLTDMTQIGVGIMQSIPDESGLMSSLVRASDGMQQLQEEIVAKYGVGIQPYIPAIYSRMREHLGEQADTLMPSSRFLLPWGWAPGVVKTNRLKRAEAMMTRKKNPLSREEALQRLITPGKGLSKGSPQVVEQAAAMGASFLTLGRQADDEIYQQFRPGGAYFTNSPLPNQKALFAKDLFEGEAHPLNIDLTDAAETIGVSQPFGTQRQIWDQMMRHTFGAGLKDDELNTLADLAIDLTYDTYVNAANDFSGGAEGATRLLAGMNRRGTAISPTRMKSVAQKTTYFPETKTVRGKVVPHPRAGEVKTAAGTRTSIAETFRKRGAYARSPADIASEEAQALLRSYDVPGERRVGFDVKHGRAKALDLWKAQAREVLEGEELTAAMVGAEVPKHAGKSRLTQPMVKDWLAARGVDPITLENPKGGIVPNLSQLVEIVEKGAPLNVGLADAASWYPRVAEEIERIVGRGNYEDAALLLDFIGITSTATEVSKNAEFALRALAEWKWGKDDMLKQLGVSGPQFDAMRQEGLLRTDFQANQRTKVLSAMNEFVTRRGQPGRMPKAVQGGAKTHNYAGSILVNIWRSQMDTAITKMGNTALARSLKKSFDDALSIYTVDRHDARISNLATAVNPIEETLLRERGLIAATKAGLSGEQAQAAGWYWVRDRQGFMREVRPDSDMMFALRKTMRDVYEQTPVGERQKSWDDLFAEAGRTLGLDPTDAANQDALYTAVYDMIRQEQYYRLLKKSFDVPEVKIALRKAGLPDTLGEMHGDVLSHVMRGAQGVAPEEMPHPLGIINRPSGVTPAEWQGGEPGLDLLAQVEGALPTGQPTVFAFDGQAWVPAPPTGIVVPLASVGSSLDPKKAKTTLKALNRFLSSDRITRLFDPVEGFGNDEHLVFSLEPNAAGGMDFSLATVVPDQATADRLAALPPGNIDAILEAAHGPRASRPKPTLEQARQRGVSLAEMDIVNPFTWFDRKLRKPILDAYAEASLKGGVTQATGRRIDDLSLPEWPDEASHLDGYDPALTLQENQVLQTTLQDGTTYRQFLNTETARAAKDMTAIKESGATWGPYASLEEKLEAVGRGTPLAKTVKQWHDAGVDLLYAHEPDDVAGRVLKDQIRKDKGVKAARPTFYDLFKAAWGEQALLSPKYHTGNMLGNWTANALAGVFTRPSPRELQAAFKASRAGLDSVARDEAMASLKGNQTARAWGLERMPVEVMRGGVRALTMGDSGRLGGSATGEMVGRLTRSEKLGRKIGYVFTANNDMGLAVDTVGRSSLWGTTFHDAMTRDLPVWEAEVRRRAAAVEGFEFSVLDGINPPADFAFDPLKQHLVDLGLKDGDAERLARDFVEIRGQNLTEARDKLGKVQFYGDRTNLDEWIGKIVPFHYWFSRAVRYYGEETVRHPFLLLNYMRANDGIEDAQNDPGLSARQKGFLRLFGTPIGFSLLMNPDALFGVVKVFGLQDEYDPQGQTELGGAVNWVKARGFGLYPWIDGTLNLMGAYGNDFEPDLLGIRHKALVGAAINFARAHAGADPAGAPYANAMGQLRSTVSSFVASFTPDWLSQPVTPRAGGSSQEASLDSIIESVIVAEAREGGQALTNQDLLDIMSDPDSPEYDRAYREASEAGIVSQLLNFVAPTKQTMRHDARDVRQAQIDVVQEEADRRGKAPWEIHPKPDDLAFMARYKALTGKDYQAGDYASADLDHELARAPEAAKPLILAEADYKTLGTDKQRTHFEKYQALLNGEVPETAVLSDAGRQEMAKRYLTRHEAAEDVDAIYTLRDAFAAEHPEFAEFKSWQGRMGELKTQMGGSLAEYRRQASQQNPNAARYFAEREAWFNQQYPADTAEERSERIEQATMSSAAFVAITGKATIRSLMGPISGVPPADITLPNLIAPTPPSLSRDQYWSQQLAQLGGPGLIYRG